VEEEIVDAGTDIVLHNHNRQLRAS
jgi:hypothetical protein